MDLNLNQAPTDPLNLRNFKILDLVLVKCDK
jgi:hypothetical protein